MIIFIICSPHGIVSHMFVVFRWLEMFSLIS